MTGAVFMVVYEVCRHLLLILTVAALLLVPLLFQQLRLVLQLLPLHLFQTLLLAVLDH